MAVCCPLCNKRISNWEIAGGKTVPINDKIVHKACLQDYSLTEIELRIKK